MCRLPPIMIMNVRNSVTILKYFLLLNRRGWFIRNPPGNYTPYPGSSFSPFCFTNDIDVNGESVSFFEQENQTRSTFEDEVQSICLESFKQMQGMNHFFENDLVNSFVVLVLFQLLQPLFGKILVFNLQ